MKIDKWLYFRTIADEDNDDGDTGSNNQNPTSICIPTSAIRNIQPDGDTQVRINIDSVKLFDDPARGKRTSYDGADFIELNTTQGKTFEVMEAISNIINGASRTDDGFIVIADDVTTNYANETVSPEYCHPDITSCAGMSVYNQHQGLGVHEYYEVVTPIPGTTDSTNDVVASLSVKLPAQAIITEAAIVSVYKASNDIGSVALEIHSAAIDDDDASAGTEIVGADTVNLSIQGVTNAAGTKDVDNTSVPDADLDISSNATTNSTVHSGVMHPIDTATLFSSATAVTYLHITAKEDMATMTGSPQVGVYVKWWGGPAVEL